MNRLRFWLFAIVLTIAAGTGIAVSALLSRNAKPPDRPGPQAEA